MGFRMFSFQPAAYIGNRNRWKDEYRAFDGDDVWREIERGAGARLPFRAFQMGDERCNRTTHGILVGKRFIPLVDDRIRADHALRDAFYATFGGMNFQDPLLAARVLRALAAHPGAVATGVRWTGRFTARAGVVPLLRGPRRALTFVMHSFMDARDVRPAWQGLQRGEISDDPRVRATQERLQACAYAMAHPESGELVPACVQHSILDPTENLRLQELLPLPAAGARARRA
jgi:hypothetical protein